MKVEPTIIAPAVGSKNVNVGLLKGTEKRGGPVVKGASIIFLKLPW